MTVSLGEGNTPVIELPRLAAMFDLSSIRAKAEHLNPTGSYKDRIAAATMDAALAAGRRGWIGTSSGNGGAAMSAYGRRAGLPGIICVPHDAPSEKLASIRPYGALMVTMQAMGPVVMAELERIARQENLQLTITTHAHNPEGMRGADGIGTEIAAQVAGLTHLYVPVGGGGLLVATARGLARAGSGAAVVACQPAGCAPVVGVLDGRLSQPVVDACDTDVSGLQLPEPPDGMAAVQAVRTSGGWGTAVSDEQVLRAQDLLTTVEGVFVEPAAAVALAALLQDRRAGRLDSSATAAVVLSGNGLKDLRRFRSPDGATREADVDDLAGIVTAHLASREQGSAE